MNVTQCRMARAALNWSLDDLAKASGVARRTIARFEANQSVLPDNVAAIQKAFEVERVRFIDSGPFAGGVYRSRAG